MEKTPPFSREMKFKYGALEEVAPSLRRLVCHNPSAFTFKGTNLYVLGQGEVAVVDPGPASGEQLDALLAALNGEKVTHIFVTHCHGDHTGAVEALKARTGAKTYGMPRAASGVERKGPSGRSFVIPVHFDNPLQDGSRVTGKDWEIEAVHTPGHAPDHLCYSMKGQATLLSGDHVMGWNTSVIAPPEGHMGSYMRSLERLMDREERVYFPGHGGPINEPHRFVKALIFHRRWREAEILECLQAGITTISEMVPRIYSGIEPALSGAAAMAVLAQLEYLIEKEIVGMREPGPLGLDREFTLLKA